MKKQEISFIESVMKKLVYLGALDTCHEIIISAVFYKWYANREETTLELKSAFSNETFVNQIDFKRGSFPEIINDYFVDLESILDSEPQFRRTQKVSFLKSESRLFAQAIALVFEELSNYKGDLAKLFEYCFSLLRRGDFSTAYFDTSDSINTLMVKCLTVGQKKTALHKTVYDPTSGLGSSLLKFSEENKQAFSYFGQEINAETAVFSVMNLMVHGVEDFTISSGDTLSNPKFLDGNTVSKFDYVIAHPPFRVRNHRKYANSGEDLYNRWNPEIGNDSYLDGALFSHLIASMADQGRAAVIIPNSFLTNNTRAESFIRKNIIDKDLLKGVIHLPSHVFSYTSVSSTILLLGKYDFIPANNVFFIDGRHHFIKNEKINELDEEIIKKHISSLFDVKEADNYSILVNKEELENNNYFLHAGRYFIDRYISEERSRRNEMCLIKDAITPIHLHRNSEEGSFLPLISVQHLNNNIRLPIDRIEVKELRKSDMVLDQSAILIAVRNNALAYSYFEYEGKKVGLSSHISAFTFTPAVVTLPYLIKQFSEDYFKYVTENYFAGTSMMLRLPVQAFLDFPIKLEPLERQNQYEDQYLDYFHQEDKNLNILERQKKLLFEENAALRHSIAGPLSNIKSFFNKINEILEDNRDKLISDVLDGHASTNLRYNFKEIQAIIHRDLDKIDSYIVKQLDVESRIQSVQLAPLDLDACLIKYVDEIKTRKPDIEIVYDSFVEYLIEGLSKEPYVTIQGNEELLHTLLDNLLENAEKHAFSDDEQNRFEILLHFDEEQEEKISIEVNNTGKSFPKDLTIEDFLAKGRKSGSNAGTGYGGWYIRQILNKLGGEIGIFDSTVLKEEIREGYTTSIVIELPLIGFINGE